MGRRVYSSYVCELVEKGITQNNMTFDQAVEAAAIFLYKAYGSDALATDLDSETMLSAIDDVITDPLSVRP